MVGRWPRWLAWWATRLHPFLGARRTKAASNQRGIRLLSPTFLDLVPAPSWLNSGHTAWQLVAGTLVGLMSVPGLAILYSGLMKRKWAVNSALMVLYAFGATLVVWTLWGYKMSFGTQAT